MSHDLAELSDEELVPWAVEGDRAALEELLRRHRPTVLTICAGITGNPEDALDACQNTLIRVANGIRGFRSEARFTTWLRTIAVNAARAELEQRGRRPYPVGSSPLPREVVRGVDGQVTDGVRVRQALDALDPEFRTVVVLRHLCGCDYQEIADVLRIPMGTVKSRLSRARLELVNRLRLE
ncbi:RNA polymerase sigma factor [Streptomyces sp. DSM 44917]|uniref:RNA polymerase sigma factor n=1 Tax=Streptomyces boetiae TaxID=3075541 RepID=A0ABU2L8W0_9ACTN|nr:RNA polymerase sigma factor [Streptomyces sp. DSM 44917]MDT0308011.1 RNA polymerase sigma factor [Streptomyces sp. DSM 44917]